MKSLHASFLAILITVAAPLRLTAEEPASAFGLTPAPAPAKPETLFPEAPGALPLIPESMPPLDKPAKRSSKTEENVEKPSKTSAAEDALKELIKVRLAKTKAQRDPGLQAIWDSRLEARTDFEQRAIMTKYYTGLCALMVKIDKTLTKETIDTLRGHYLGSYDQTRIAPTIDPATFPKRK